MKESGESERVKENDESVSGGEKVKVNKCENNGCAKQKAAVGDTHECTHTHSNTQHQCQMVRRNGLVECTPSLGLLQKGSSAETEAARSDQTGCDKSSTIGGGPDDRKT